MKIWKTTPKAPESSPAFPYSSLLRIKHAVRSTNAQACASQLVLWFCFAFLCSSQCSGGSVTDREWDTDPSAMGEWSWAHPAQSDTEPNKRQEPNPDPELFSVTLQAQKEMENLEMDVSAMNALQTLSKPEVLWSPALSPTEMLCTLLSPTRERLNSGKCFQTYPS